MSDADQLLEHPADLRQELRDLRATIQDLQEELDEERERRQELEDRIKIKTPPDRNSSYIEDLHIEGFPVGLLLTAKADESDLDELEERIDNAFQDSATAGISHEDALPIQQVTNTWKTEPNSLSATQRRAAQVWSNFLDACTTTKAKHVLTSSDITTILAAEGENTHRQTRKDVMELVSELGRHYITLEDRDGQLALVIDRAPFEEFLTKFQEGESS